MTAEPSEQLRRFLRDYVSSYEELEVLLLLAGHPALARTGAEVAASLNASVESIVVALEALAATGDLLCCEQRGGATYYSYAPSSEELRELVAGLERAYAEQRIAIIQIMSSNAFERMRGATARRLADAFRLERPKK